MNVASAELNTKPLRVVIGVGGGIAAYKAAHLVRYFTERGHQVRVIPTRSALNFVGAATFEALSGQPVATDVFDAVDEVQHVRLGQEADLIVVAPATADLMARIAHGRADDLLTASCLVATCPVVLAPAMHTEMWLNPATVDNVATLRSHGLTVLDPAHGRLTGKDTGAGRLPEPEQIGELALTVLADREAFTRDLEGKKVVISAGGTHEPLDPVRYLGNASSGRQGYALAEVAAQRGAEVTLVAGVTENLPTPIGAELVRVKTAREMQQAVMEHAPSADVVVMAAAVADYRPAEVAESKMKKDSEADLSTIKLTENPDILAGVVEARRQGDVASTTKIVGFAAETGDENNSPLDLARKKLKKKGCDLLMCNAVGEGKVFGQPDSSGWILRPNGDVTEVPEGPKTGVAAAIWRAVCETH
ncbi:bifunctional phosphopantothenoylcysteine decarboxylase/phosphopantothenate--cysteine ligase CoaBC [Corynebacterium jeikeium]|uniref:Coenzyme A biosynthesis bifunctional protein CoaBC n=1 Tax=Corynebacterium jeikeium (strain K411) TaxID=306537 RepID=Q4JVH6_CORJK|nr:bifunctional phosphopantothenoylcysteine decarboxylase/phosphopantothenate--cysteine ligase CoaBC [Corynebacterium jeikeium]OOD34030.1 phosphopantothenoylcysteine decarboxylase [Corynebacterium jeikeium]WCZ53570.1 Coenzyme A biosynthesis bifunctional protein CoaBC [Corynebacterium jeikeium]CAI37181.1 phosphopantothenate cysteine ligase / 4'-phospho-pantothenoyl-cysteine decarboxylase [Corynebacterium jeikeium K411]SUY81119.1 bifunctional phosphopantothenoylcysteine decarboxylase/phosphopanto